MRVHKKRALFGRVGQHRHEGLSHGIKSDVFYRTLGTPIVGRVGTVLLVPGARTRAHGPQLPIYFRLLPFRKQRRSSHRHFRLFTDCRRTFSRMDSLGRSSHGIAKGVTNLGHETLCRLFTILLTLLSVCRRRGANRCGRER